MSNIEHQNKNGEWVDCNDAVGRCKLPKRQKQASGGKGSRLGTAATKAAPSSTGSIEHYSHPQGKEAYVSGDKVVFLKNGKKAASSATADALRAGRGRWVNKGVVSDESVPSAAKTLLAGGKPTREKPLRELFPKGYSDSDFYYDDGEIVFCRLGDHDKPSKWLKTHSDEGSQAQISNWVVENAHRIYDAMEDFGLNSDSMNRENLFSFASEKTGRGYDEFYDSWLDEVPMKK